MKKNSSRSEEIKAVDKRNASAKNAPGRTGSQPPDYQAVVGLDVGDRKTHYCVLGLDGELVVEGAVATRKASLQVQFEGKVKMRSPGLILSPH